MTNIASDGIKVKELLGTQIYLSEGSFWASIGGTWIKRAKQLDLEREITKRSTSITILEAPSYLSEPQTIEVTSIEKVGSGYGRGVKYRTSTGSLSHIGLMYHPDEEFVAKVTDILRRSKESNDAYNAEYEAAHSTLVRISDSELETMLSEARARTSNGT